MYFVIEVFTEPYALEEEIVRDKNKIITISQNINKIYKQIKKNEHSPGTDYLYNNMKSTNLEKTIAKLETMNNLGAEYIPRIE
jgi:DNA-directed RNA polymerase beta' subunit